MNRIFKIIVTETNKIKCSVVDTQGNEKNVTIHSKESEYEYIPKIKFCRNEIVCCEETDQSIEFLTEWIEHPEAFKEYSVTFQQTTYSLIAEVLFSLIVNEFKQQVEKKWIISSTIFEYPSTISALVVSRMKVSLQAIGLEIELEDDIDYDYQSQGDSLEEILSKHQEFQRFKTQIERAKRYATPEQMTKLTIDWNEEDFTSATEQKVHKQFTPQERSQLKLCTLNNYCVFIASRYFNDIIDFKNLERGCKKFYGNTTKFFYNPISVDSYSLKLFTHLETLHLYDKYDYTFPTTQSIKRRVVWYPVTAQHISQLSETEKQGTEFRRILLNDRNGRIGGYGNRNDDENGIQPNIYIHKDGYGELVIPKHVICLEKGCCQCCRYTSIKTENEMLVIKDRCFGDSGSLETIQLPLYCTSISTECFINCGSLRNIVIPEWVKILKTRCFAHCYSLSEIIIPNSVTIMEDECFLNCSSLSSIVLSTNLTQIGNRSFDRCLSLASISIPLSIKKLPSKCFNECTSLSTIVLHSEIISFGNYCFNKCQNLTLFRMPDSVKTLGDHCFFHCKQLQTIFLSSKLKSIPPYCFTGCNKITDIIIPLSCLPLSPTLYNQCPHLRPNNK